MLVRVFLKDSSASGMKGKDHYEKVVFFSRLLREEFIIGQSNVDVIEDAHAFKVCREL